MMISAEYAWFSVPSFIWVINNIDSRSMVVVAGSKVSLLGIGDRLKAIEITISRAHIIESSVSALCGVEFLHRSFVSSAAYISIQ